VRKKKKRLQWHKASPQACNALHKSVEGLLVQKKLSALRARF
jgi:hypothetical protein